MPFAPSALRVCIFGAMPSTGNLGVTALCHALVAGIARRAPGADITVFDDLPGVRSAAMTGAGGVISYRLRGVIPTRRIYRRDALWRLQLANRLGVSAPALDPLRSADVVMDVTGGDSFTDLYGSRRFARGIAEKRLVLDAGVPLILAPQTIGPFEGRRARREAARVLKQAWMVWARDDDSLRVVQDLLGDAMTPGRHRAGVDLAFALEACPPSAPLSTPIDGWLADRHPIVGLNVSGLIFNRPATARKRFGLQTDYAAATRHLLTRFLHETDHRVMLVPHVITRPGHFEHDPDAAAQLVADLPPSHRSRVAIADGLTEPGAAKWLIGHCDWFCATRMHAAIAALSSGVPTAALAYSGKTSGVFATCGQEACVSDLRTDRTDDDVVARTWRSFERRAAIRVDLERRMPTIRGRAERQMDAMLAHWLPDFAKRMRPAQRLRAAA